jgi:hypothetical protein
MAQISVPTLAGIASTVIFAWSVLPMLAKAYRTQNLASYSLGNLVLANVGNAVALCLRVQPAVRADLGPARLLPRHQLVDAGLVAAVRARP